MILVISVLRVKSTVVFDENSMTEDLDLKFRAKYPEVAQALDGLDLITAFDAERNLEIMMQILQSVTEKQSG